MIGDFGGENFILELMDFVVILKRILYDFYEDVNGKRIIIVDIKK